jgi:hypothetical protein
VLLANDLATLFELVLDDHHVAQEALGHRVGMSQDTVSAIVGRRQKVEYVRVYRRVVDGLEMPDEAVEWLLTGACPCPCASDGRGG